MMSLRESWSGSWKKPKLLMTEFRLHERPKASYFTAH